MLSEPRRDRGGVCDLIVADAHRQGESATGVPVVRWAGRSGPAESSSKVSGLDRPGGSHTESGARQPVVFSTGRAHAVPVVRSPSPPAVLLCRGYGGSP